MKELFKDRAKIRTWLKIVNIDEYRINSDFTVDVSKTVNLNNRKITRIPIQFGIIEGHFYIDDNQLTSLKGSPKVVIGDFSAKNNQLASLEFCPEDVHGFFIISDNKIKNFQYAPKEISGDIICIKNPLESLMELNSIFEGTLQYHLKDHTPIPHFEQFYDDGILTLTHEEIKAVQIHSSLQSQLGDKTVAKKLNKI